MTNKNESSLKKNWWRIGVVASIVLVALTIYLADRFLRDEAVTYEDPVEHFKYGSTGGERNLGFPYWIWRVLPDVQASPSRHGPGLSELRRLS